LYEYIYKYSENLTGRCPILILLSEKVFPIFSQVFQLLDLGGTSIKGWHQHVKIRFLSNVD